MPAPVAHILFARLRDHVLAQLTSIDPAVPGWFVGRPGSDLQIGRTLIAHAGSRDGSRAGVPLGLQVHDTALARDPFIQAFPECAQPPAWPTIPIPIPIHVPRAEPGRGAQEWPRVFGSTHAAAAGDGPVFQVDMYETDAWDPDAQLSLGPDDRVSFVIKPRGQAVVKRLFLQDAIDRGYLLLDLRERTLTLPGWARLLAVR